jgi:predicted flavoprotein YhiN
MEGQIKQTIKQLTFSLSRKENFSTALVSAGKGQKISSSSLMNRRHRNACSVIYNERRK